ncbi:hypothetical protein ABTK48_20250, partial [Acinetobacter baumannii]
MIAGLVAIAGQESGREVGRGAPIVIGIIAAFRPFAARAAITTVAAIPARAAIASATITTAVAIATRAAITAL